MPNDVSSKFIHKMLVVILIYHPGCSAMIGLFVTANCIIDVVVKVRQWIVDINNLFLIVRSDHGFIVVLMDTNYFVDIHWNVRIFIIVLSNHRMVFLFYFVKWSFVFLWNINIILLNFVNNFVKKNKWNVFPTNIIGPDLFVYWKFFSFLQFF